MSFNESSSALMVSFLSYNYALVSITFPDLSFFSGSTENGSVIQCRMSKLASDSLEVAMVYALSLIIVDRVFLIKSLI